MIFYKATDGAGRVHWLTVQTDAKAIDRNFEQHDIANDKPSILKMMNEYEERLFAARKASEGAGPPLMAELSLPAEIAGPVLPPDTAAVVERPVSGVEILQKMKEVERSTPDLIERALLEAEPQLAARFAAAAVDRVGELGPKLREELVGMISPYKNRNAFYRGCALLNEVAAYTS